MQARAFAAFLILTAGAFAWLEPWQYRLPVTLNNTGSGLTDYQASITVNTASLINASKMHPDCGDIRLANETNEISFWLESGCDTTATKIWARVPSIPNGASTVYVYYGNTNPTGYFSTGTGSDGYVTISSAKNINANAIAAGRAYADGVAYAVSAIGTNTVTVSPTPNGIVAGDEIGRAHV
jgi:hypothetical protein